MVLCSRLASNLAFTLRLVNPQGYRVRRGWHGPCPQRLSNPTSKMGVGGIVGRVLPPNIPSGLIVALGNWAQGALSWTWIPTASGPTTGGSGSIVTATIKPIPPGCQPG